MTLVVGTAGHIDHGKTALLRALTGIDADRLPEERRRGMTIDLGYAHLAVPGGPTLDFVDVPGHDRLVGNMLVGAGEVDAALLVVAADDGPRAQTVEHLELLDALAIRPAVVALTKADLVERPRLAVVAELVRRLIAGTSLDGARIAAVSVVTGVGVEALRDALVDLAAAARPTHGPGPRLAIDRVFSVRGRGTVVTGSLRGGRVATGDQLVLEPGGREVRVREVQVHGSTVDASIGGRTALNLAGVAAGELRRGQVLAAPGVVTAADRLLVALRPPASIDGSRPELPTDRAAVRLHLGTEQVGARVGRSGREAVDLPDGAASALLRLERPIAVAAGDRLALRRPSPGRAAGGGLVLDPEPPRGVARRRANAGRLLALHAAVVDLAVAGATHPAGTSPDGVAAARLDLHGALEAGLRLAPDVAEAARAAVADAVAARHAARPDAPGLALADARAVAGTALRRLVALDPPDRDRAAARLIDELARAGTLVRSGDHVHAPGHRPAGPSPRALAAMDRLVAALDVVAPPALSTAARATGCGPDDVRGLEREGRIVLVEPDLAWSRAAWERLARLALEQAAAGPLSPAAFRDATGTSRKFVLALLEDLGRRGILVRTPEGHRPGPRAAAFVAAHGSGDAPAPPSASASEPVGQPR